MRNIILAGLVVACSIIIIGSFFMPWARVKVSATQVSKELTTAAENELLKDTPFAGKFVKRLEEATSKISRLGDIEVKTQVSGYDIPTMVNKKSSRTALSFAQGYFKDAKDMDKKSMLVFLLPLFAILCIALAALGLKNRWAVVVMLILTGILSLEGLYHLYTADFSKTAVQVTIERGLWQTFYGYLVIFVTSIVWISSGNKK